MSLVDGTRTRYFFPLADVRSWVEDQVGLGCIVGGSFHYSHGNQCRHEKGPIGETDSRRLCGPTSGFYLTHDGS